MTTKSKPALKSAAKPAAKRSPARSQATPPAGKQRGKTATPVLKIPKTTRWAPQQFMVKHLKERDFKKGLRSYASYRDLGVFDATSGGVQAHVIRLHGPCDPGVVSIPHLHGVQFQFLYMLKGWLLGEYGGKKVRMEEGTCLLQPNSIPHTVLDYSDGCEMIELILPGTFKTVEL